jgi:hypothetical protein
VIAATAPGGVASQRRVEAKAGAEQRVRMMVSSPLRSTHRAGANGRAARSATPGRASERARERPVPRFAFYAGTALTGALTGVTVWSGVDTLRARGRLPGTVEQTRNVADRARRTDWLLAGTLIAAALTATVGVVWVEWGGP